MMVLGEVEEAAEIEAGAISAADDIRGLMEDLAAQRELVGDLALDLPTREPEVLVARAGIDPVAAAAIGRPVAEALLHPERQEFARMACAEAAMSVAGRYLQHREDADHRLPAFLILLDEPVLHAKFGVAVAGLPVPAARLVEGERRDNVKL